MVSNDKKTASMDLLFKAYEVTTTEGKVLVEQALALDPENVDAYNYLAVIDDDINKALKLYEKAMKLGEKEIGKITFDQRVGHFWGVVETRPYMRAKDGFAECLFELGRKDEAISHYKQIIELNTNDNLGIRYLLSTIFLELQYFDDYKKLYKTYEEERSALWLFNHALYLFMTGNIKKSDLALKKAIKMNPYVIDYLLSKKDLPDELPEYIGRGDVNEAVSYVAESFDLWHDFEGAKDWLNQFSQGELKIVK